MLYCMVKVFIIVKFILYCMVNVINIVLLVIGSIYFIVWLGCNKYSFNWRMFIFGFLFIYIVNKFLVYVVIRYFDYFIIYNRTFLISLVLGI